MSYLIDTCVLSEAMKRSPDSRVIEWIDGAPSDALFVSALTLGEIRKGVEGMGPGRRRERIGAWLEIELPAWFDDRVLPIDAAVADRWGRLTSRRIRTLPAIDALLAATALHHRLAIVTRNIADFTGTGVSLINPWDGSGDKGTP
ncbi:MAG TPA: type II toxin-antitoxin system VapC family toxin [Stellaceae bacterium]